jgi:hypothetical protein
MDSAMKRFGRVLLATSAAVATTAMLAGTALAQPTPLQPIGQKQFFAGEVNGNIGGSVLSVQGCGPSPVATPNEAVGHPLPGQTVAVRRFLVPPPGPGGNIVGYTGRAHKISADLQVSMQEPPIIMQVHVGDLSAYGQTATIPTTLGIPCDATVVAVFTPVNGGAKAVVSKVALTLGNPVIVLTSPPPPATAAAAATTLEGTGFAPNANYTVAECSKTNWIAPQNPCVNSNDVTVATGSTGGFTHGFAVRACSPALVSTCFVGVPLPSGVDTIELVGAAPVIVP